MQMEAGLDTGPVLHSGEVAIAAEDTAASLHDKLAVLGGRLVVDVLANPLLAEASLPARQQPGIGVTYASKIEKVEALLDWRLSAEQLDRQVRAFNPFPGAFFALPGTTVKVWKAEVAAGAGEPGQVLAVEREGILVACGEASLRLTELQKAGAKRLPVAQFLAGTPVRTGDRLVATPP
jgi:methionyl-tRNA formyltransferase